MLNTIDIVDEFYSSDKRVCSLSIASEQYHISTSIEMFVTICEVSLSKKMAAQKETSPARQRKAERRKKNEMV
jgi:hypothetical protein